jgi:hypothetical protein
MQISQLTDEISQLQERLTSKKQQLVELEDARSRYVDQVRRDYSYYYQYCNGVDASDDDGVPRRYYGYSSDDDVWQCPTCRTCIRAYCHCNDRKVPWTFAKGEYERYKSFDGVDISDRNALSKRLLQEEDPSKKRVFQMFLDITREDNIFPENYFTPGQLKRLFNREDRKLLK